MKCPNCRKTIDDDSKFCPICGVSLEIKCPKCGQINTYPASFCKSCGTKLIEDEPAKEPKVKEKKPRVRRVPSYSKIKLSPLFSIISMSSMLGLIVLIMGLVFAPFGVDDFFPSSSYTLISYIHNVFYFGIDGLSKEFQFVEIANAFILIILLGVLIGLSIFYIAKNTPKFIKSIKEKEYFNFAKPAAIIFAVYFCTFVYFTQMVLNQNGNVFSKPGFAPVFIIVIASIAFAFNLFTKEFLLDNHYFPQIIVRIVSKVITFTLLFVIVFHLGGVRFYITASNLRPNGHTLQGDVSNSGMMDFIGKAGSGYFAEAVPFFTKSIIFSGVAMLCELVALVLSALIIYRIFTCDLSLTKKPTFIMVSSIIILTGSILILLFNEFCKSNLNQINPETVYGGDTLCVLNNSRPNVCLVVAIILSIMSIGFFVFEVVKKSEEA